MAVAPLAAAHVYYFTLFTTLAARLPVADHLEVDASGAHFDLRARPVAGQFEALTRRPGLDPPAGIVARQLTRHGDLGRDEFEPRPLKRRFQIRKTDRLFRLGREHTESLIKVGYLHLFRLRAEVEKTHGLPDVEGAHAAQVTSQLHSDRSDLSLSAGGNEQQNGKQPCKTLRPFHCRLLDDWCFFDLTHFFAVNLSSKWR